MHINGISSLHRSQLLWIRFFKYHQTVHSLTTCKPKQYHWFGFRQKLLLKVKHKMKYLFIPVELTVTNILDSGSWLTIIFFAQQTRALCTEKINTTVQVNFDPSLWADSLVCFICETTLVAEPWFVWVRQMGEETRFHIPSPYSSLRLTSQGSATKIVAQIPKQVSLLAG